MMIIDPLTVAEVKDQGDILTMTKITDVEPQLVLNHHERTFNERGGFNRTRTQRKIASIPAHVFFSHPGFFGDDQALKTWLRKHPEYTTVRRGSF